MTRDRAERWSSESGGKRRSLERDITGEEQGNNRAKTGTISCSSPVFPAHESLRVSDLNQTALLYFQIGRIRRPATGAHPASRTIRIRFGWLEKVEEGLPAGT